MSAQELRLALLHEIASRLGDAGKIQLQKLVYFLQEAMGVPTKYPYRMHHYGPYAEALETDLARLRFAGYINIRPDEKGYGFHIRRADGPREEWVPLLTCYRQELDQAIETFGKYPVPQLELAATIHYMKSLRPDRPTDELLRVVRSLKPKFDASEVAAAYSDLESRGLLR